MKLMCSTKELSVAHYIGASTLQVNLPKLHSGRIDCRGTFLAACSLF